MRWRWPKSGIPYWVTAFWIALAVYFLFGKAWVK